MPAVKHMKWWGWGVDGVSFHHEDKPALGPFVREAVDVDVWSASRQRRLKLEDLDIHRARDRRRAARRTDRRGRRRERRSTTTSNGSCTPTARASATCSGCAPATSRGCPTWSSIPADEAEVQAIVDRAVEADAVLIPFGGGSNISGSLQAPEDETRPVISVDLGRLNQVLDIDEESGLARIQAGALGPDIEDQLRPTRLDARPLPRQLQPQHARRLGRDPLLGHAVGQVRRHRRHHPRPAGRACPVRCWSSRPLPATSTGPSVREMILGSEGRLGVITEVTVQVHRIPEERQIIGYLFPNWEAGLAAMQDISTSDARPSVTRVSDAKETRFSFATRKKSKGPSISSLVSKGLMKVLEKRGWDLDEVCLSFVGYEGGKSHVAREKSIVKDIIGKHGGIALGKGPGALYDQKKFDTPYIRDFLLDRGAAADVSETAAPWSKLLPLYTNVIAAGGEGRTRNSARPAIMCHLSHSYHSGACLYFTFAFRHDGVDPLAQYDQLKSAIQQQFVDSDATLSHHHAVGTEHARWLEEDISAPGVRDDRRALRRRRPGPQLQPGQDHPD